MRAISDALLAAQIATSRTPYIKMLTTNKAGDGTVDLSTDSVAYGNRILSIDHYEEPYNEYATVILSDPTSVIPDIHGYWTEIGYGLQVPNPIDVGSEATDRASFFGVAAWTLIDTTNPANLTGTITSIEVWAKGNMDNLQVGTFYLVSGTTYKCRASQSVGAVTAGSKQTFTVSLSVVAGDFIGCYYTGGTGDIEVGAGGSGFYYLESAECIDPNDQAVFTYWGTDTMSLKAIGTATASIPDYTNAQTSRLWVKHQRHITIEGQVHTVLELEGLWSRLREIQVLLGNPPYYHKTYTTDTVYSIISAILVTNGMTVDALGGVTDGIIDVLVPDFEINNQSFEYSAGVLSRLIDMTKCYLRAQANLVTPFTPSFKVVYPASGDADQESYYVLTAPYFISFMERVNALIPNSILVIGNKAGSWNKTGTAIDQAEIDRLYTIQRAYLAAKLTGAGNPTDVTLRAQAILAKSQGEQDSGRLIVHHDGRVELYDRVAVYDDRQTPQKKYPTNSLTRVSALRHIYVSGLYQLEITLGGVSATVLDETTASTYIEGVGTTAVNETPINPVPISSTAVNPIWLRPVPESPRQFDTIKEFSQSLSTIGAPLTAQRLGISQTEFNKIIAQNQTQAVLKQFPLGIRNPADLAKAISMLPPTHPTVIQSKIPAMQAMANIMAKLFGRKAPTPVKKKWWQR